jgi:phosphopantothenoylcysteine decarboxylase/phosphopantothenate--cysteine ligase
MDVTPLHDGTPVNLQDKHILLGVSGGVAAYKACELARLLTRAGAQVQAVLTRAACEFVTPLSLQALTGRPARVELFDAAAESGMDHIALARWADAIVVAPASADFLSRVARGTADDLLTTLCLASEAPLWLAPAMNRVMWAAPATQENARLLAARGARLLGPAEGDQACGETGPGRMLEAAEIARALAAHFGGGALAGLRLLLTAGPTREALDPVRFISNRSSGRMGYALAQAAAEAGAAVTLVSGPVALSPPPGVTRVSVESAQEMHAAVLARAAQADIFIGVAAVSDWRPAQALPEKMKKSGAPPALALEATPDILAAVAALSPRPFCVGFAAETARVRDYALDKLARKQLDLIAANEVGHGRGFEADDNALLALWPGGEQALPLAPKPVLARQLISLIAERYRAAHPAENS